jgi:hypothetical protein
MYGMIGEKMLVFSATVTTSDGEYTCTVPPFALVLDALPNPVGGVSLNVTLFVVAP